MVGGRWKVGKVVGGRWKVGKVGKVVHVVWYGVTIDHQGGGQ